MAALSFSALLSTRSPHEEGYTPSVSPRSPFLEGGHEGVRYTSEGQPVISMFPEEDAKTEGSELSLASIRLSFRDMRRRQGPDRSLRRDLFEQPIPSPLSKKTIAWMLKAQDQIFLPSETRDVDELIAQYEEDSCQRPEFHRLYVQLHLSRYEQAKYFFVDSLRTKFSQEDAKTRLAETQKKTEEVFLQFVQKFPKDVLIWKIFVTFLKTTIFHSPEKGICYYDPQEIVQLLDSLKLRELRSLAWFQAVIRHFGEEKLEPSAYKISETLRKCVEAFQGKLDSTSQWVLKAEDALTRVNGKKGSSGETPEVQLTPKKNKSLLDRLISQFEQKLASNSSLPAEVHRFYLRLKMKSIQAQEGEGDSLKLLLSQYREKCPEDLLAEYHIFSFLSTREEYSAIRKRCSELIPKVPYLSWMEMALKEVEEHEKCICK